ncbi:MAG: 50S ribosomal protein L4 [Patescibacteria group bacterium]
MTIDIFDKQNKKTETMELPERIFKVKFNSTLIHQALLAQIANQRSPLAHAKGRGEVSGGGKKPWRQKGTGRARHGSIRSPIWKGGGVTFGPSKERIFAKKINKKMNRLAIFSVLSKKAEDGDLKIFEKFEFDIKKAKTAAMVKFLNNLFGGKKSVLLVSSLKNNINKVVSNIKNVNAIGSQSLNVHDLLKYKNIIFEKEAISEIEKHYV